MPAFSELDEAHLLWGGQYALVSPQVQMQSHLETLSQTIPKQCLTRYLGIAQHSGYKINHRSDVL